MYTMYAGEANDTKREKVKPSYSKENKQKENLPFLGAAASAPFTSTAAWRP